MEKSRNEITYAWQVTGLVILCIRFVQGFIFWGGGSRRFIYAPQKLDPYATQWMANKLQSAMPGALLGVSHLINYLLQHFILLYVSIIIFSLFELISGACLIVGFMTRLAGFGTACISIVLMLIFGWEGSTCLDEWTMAVCNLAMGLTLALAGSSEYSIDHWLWQRYKRLRNSRWFRWLASGPITFKHLKETCFAFVVFTILFTLGTYDYYRGAIFSRYHPGPVSAITHHLQLSNGTINAQGVVQFTAYVNAGNTAIPANIMRIELRDAQQKIIATWNGADLSQLNTRQINNAYLYNQILPGPFGLEAPVSARAKITLQIPHKIKLTPNIYQLSIFTVDGHRWQMSLKFIS
jgi:thiosulfate dehydrogenase (quinone)